MKETGKKSHYLKLKTFKQSPSLAHLGDDELWELANLATHRRFAKGEFIFIEGDPPDFLYIVQEGRVKLFKGSSSGKSLTFSIAHYGDTLHGIVLFTGKPCWISAQAMDEVTLLCLRAEAFLSFVTRHPSILMKIIEILGNQIHSTNLRLIDVVSVDVKQRLLNVLSMLSSKFGSTLFFTNEELAELAGTTTETTIRIMGQLKKSGVIDTRRGEVRIKDCNRLDDLSSDFIMI